MRGYFEHNGHKFRITYDKQTGKFIEEAMPDKSMLHKMRKERKKQETLTDTTASNEENMGAKS